MVSCQKDPTRNAYTHGRQGPFGRIPSILSAQLLVVTVHVVIKFFSNIV